MPLCLSFEYHSQHRGIVIDDVVTCETGPKAGLTFCNPSLLPLSSLLPPTSFLSSSLKVASPSSQPTPLLNPLLPPSYPKRIVTVAVAALALACALGFARGDDSVRVALTRKATSDPLPSDYVSFSIEVFNVPNTFSFPKGSTTPRSSWANLMNNLRVAVNGGKTGRGPNIRVGGNSADLSVFLPGTAPLPTGDTYRVTETDFTSYTGAVPLWNGSLTLDLNFRDGANDSLALGHMKAAKAYVSSSGVALWDLVEQVEVGNEVDVYRKNGIRNTTYTYDDYIQEFEGYARGIIAVGGDTIIQGATFDRGSDGGYIPLTPAYAKKFSNPRSIGTISIHHYSLSVCGGHTNTIGELLEDAAAEGAASSFKANIEASLAVNTPLYVGEGNSISCGGQSGISDVYAATLWSVDILLAMASVGLRRFNFHGEPLGPYSAVWYENNATSDSADVKPLYYGLWCVNTFISGGAQMVATSTLDTNNPYIKVWSVVDEAGTQRVIVIHKNMNSTAPASIGITLPAGVSLSQPGVLVRLTPGPGGVSSSTGITFGGLTFDGTSDGLPTGTPASESVPADSDNTGYTFSMQPLTIAILTLPKQ